MLQNGEKRREGSREGSAAGRGVQHVTGNTGASSLVGRLDLTVQT